METLNQTNLKHFAQKGSFLWATGIEDTFITHPWPATGRTLDEYELTLHYDRWQEDVRLFAQLGVGIVRYGIPWHRINPAPGQWDWAFPDAVFDRLEELGIQPVVDLVHYGVPAWLRNAYADPDFPDRMAEYARRAAERYRGRLFAFTPLNEPRVTAWYCGKLGWWPPGLRGWKGFLRVMMAICQGIVKTVQALAAVDPEIVPCHVDATDLYESSDPGLAQEVGRRQEIVFLALDVISGRVTPDHPLYPWLLKNGVSPETLAWFVENPIPLPLIGINLYPLFSRKILAKGARGLRIRMPYTGADIIDRLATLYWERYKVPLWISETASEGKLKVRQNWLRDSVAAVVRVRQAGIPLVGYTWWPLFALVTWGYRQGTKPPEAYLKQMGLWDLEDTADRRLERVPTDLVAEFKQLVAAGVPVLDQSKESICSKASL